MVSVFNRGNICIFGITLLDTDIGCHNDNRNGIKELFNVVSDVIRIRVRTMHYHHPRGIVRIIPHKIATNAKIYRSPFKGRRCNIYPVCNVSLDDCLSEYFDLQHRIILNKKDLNRGLFNLKIFVGLLCQIPFSASTAPTCDNFRFFTFFKRIVGIFFRNRNDFTVI